MSSSQNWTDTQKRVEEAFRNAAREVEEAGRRIGRSLQDGSLQGEAEQLIAHLNDKVVPEIRSQSTEALRVAAKKLSELADFMDRKSQL